jgi:hypothetical protein
MAIAARMNRRLPHKSSPPLTDLLSHPEKITEAIEQERRAKSPSGWLGIQILARPDWQKSLALGDGVYQVSVHPQSSAYRDVGMRTGDFLRPIEVNGGPGVPIDEFDLLELTIGTPVTLRFFRPGTGHASGWLAAALEKQIHDALKARATTGEGVRKIAARFGVDPSTVQRISRPFEGASAASVSV